MLPSLTEIRPTAGREFRKTVNWGVTQALPVAFLRRSAAKGDLQAQMIFSNRAGADVNAIIAQMRDSGPLYKSTMGYTATSHAAVKEVLVSNAFSSGFPTPGGALGKLAKWSVPSMFHPVEPPSLLVTEPPDHTRYRKLVTGVFTRRAVEKLRERTETIASDLLDAMAAKGGSPVDLVEDYCALLPVTVIAEILGVPESEQRRVLEFGAAAAPSLDLGLGWSQYRSVHAALRSFDIWLGEHLEELRRTPGDNLLSELVIASDEGEVLSPLELRATAGLVLAAGFETTVNLLSNGIALLHDNPDQRDLIAQDPGLWGNTVEEVLRLDPPVLLTGRVSKEETEIVGQRIRPDTMITTVLAGANMDPTVFEEPERFDVTRGNARDHLAFSSGRHHCLGAALARMEGEVGLRMLWERFPDLALLPGATRRTTRILRGFEVLPAMLKG